MPTLSRKEAFVLAGIRRLLVSLAAYLPEPPADPEPSGLTLILKELKLMSDTFDTEMTKLRDDVAAQSTVIASATQAFLGLATQLAAAEAAAKSAGATDAQVASVTTLRQQLEANTASLAAAIPANTDATPPAPTPTPTPTPAPSDPATSTAAPTTPSAPADTAVAIPTDAAIAAPATAS